MKSVKNYLITGGLGLIGSTLASELDGNITIVSRSDKHRDRIKDSRIKLLVKNISEISEADLRGVDVIYHCASTVDNYNVLTDPYIDVETNITGTIHILECLKNLEKKPKIIYPSTFFVYGNEYDKTGIPITEESPTDPLAIYPATKLCTESIIKLYAKLYSIPYLICRLTNVYGATESFDNKKKGALNFLIMKAMKGEDIPLYNNGEFYRDYIYVSDVVAAMRFLEDKVADDTFLVGYGKRILFGEIIRAILEQTGNKSKIVTMEPPQFHNVVGIHNFVADVSKLQKLGWRAKVDYKAGVALVVKHYTSLL